MIASLSGVAVAFSPQGVIETRGGIHRVSNIDMGVTTNNTGIRVASSDMQGFNATMFRQFDRVTGVFGGRVEMIYTYDFYVQYTGLYTISHSIAAGNVSFSVLIRNLNNDNIVYWYHEGSVMTSQVSERISQAFGRDQRYRITVRVSSNVLTVMQSVNANFNWFLAREITPPPPPAVPPPIRQPPASMPYLPPQQNEPVPYVNRRFELIPYFQQGENQYFTFSEWQHQIRFDMRSTGALNAPILVQTPVVHIGRYVAPVDGDYYIGFAVENYIHRRIETGNIFVPSLHWNTNVTNTRLTLRANRRDGSRQLTPELDIYFRNSVRFVRLAQSLRSGDELSVFQYVTDNMEWRSNYQHSQWVVERMRLVVRASQTGRFPEPHPPGDTWIINETINVNNIVNHIDNRQVTVMLPDEEGELTREYTTNNWTWNNLHFTYTINEGNYTHIIQYTDNSVQFHTVNNITNSVVHNVFNITNLPPCGSTDGAIRDPETPGNEEDRRPCHSGCNCGGGNGGAWRPDISEEDRTFLQSIWDSILGFLSGIIGLLLDIILEIFYQILSFIRLLISSLWGIASGFVSWAVGGITDFFSLFRADSPVFRWHRGDVSWEYP